MNKDEKTTEERLKIKEIKKLNREKNLCGLLKGGTLAVSVLSFIGGVLAFAEGIKGKGTNAIMLDYFMGMIALAISFIAAIETAELSDESKDYKEKIALLEEEVNKKK